MKDSPNLALVTEPSEYFRELITQTLSKQKIKTQPETEFYLVNLLGQFITTDTLFVRDQEGNLKDEPLVLKLKEAIETHEPTAQKLLFRQIGDVSLYTAGFFQESLGRKLVDVDYYIQMGGNAYQNVAQRAEEMKKVFAELAERFSTFVDVLAEVSSVTTPKSSETDILRLYELWIKTKSERAEKALKEAGIIPLDSIKKDIQ
ncbi:MAG: hypothetical protein KA715_03375 [Xanthomonadaceae bacterium]|nr:hypothetical protein [Xanthomonadaceae bacterium]